MSNKDEHDKKDERFERQRRNLFSISVAAIVFYMLDAEFGTSGSILMGSISFPPENSAVLVYVLWFGLFYFWWRFWVFGGKDARLKMHEVFVHNLKEDTNFKDYLLGKLKDEARDFANKHFSGQAGYDETSGLPVIDYGIEFSNPKFLGYTKAHGLIPGYKLKTTYNVNVAGTDRQAPAIHASNFIFTDSLVGLKHIFKGSFKDPSFGEYMLPHVAAIWASSYIVGEVFARFVIWISS